MLYEYFFRLSDGRTITVTGASSRQEALRYVINMLNRTMARNVNHETTRRSAESRRQDTGPYEYDSHGKYQGPKTVWEDTDTYKDIHGLRGGC